MSNFKEHAPKTRLLLILRAIIERPYGYTRQQLADAYSVHRDTIKTYFEEIKNAGFELDHDDKHRYALLSDKAYEHLRELLFFSENEQQVLLEALHNVKSTKLQERVRKKLDNLHDISKLGSNLITKPFLTKINLLEKAKSAKFLVKLIGYRSTNSSEVSDRLVEPFHISPKEDMLHSFDVEKKEIRHFRISRIERVEVIEVAWNYETKHHVKSTDVFRILDDKQVNFHLRVKVGGYNELTERFPLTQTCLRPAADEAGIFDFEGKVNHNFYGLSNFILGYHQYIVEILEPESLLEHIKKEVGRINF
jgi:predicted DNA-binding transcriptional regulator YafY